MVDSPYITMLDDVTAQGLFAFLKMAEQRLIEQTIKNQIRLSEFQKLCSFLFILDTVAHVKGFSTGFLPAWIPGSFILNCVLSCIPFGDHGMNAHRIMAIRDSMQLSVNVENGGRAC